MIARDQGFEHCELVTFDSPEEWAKGRHSSIGSSDGATILGEGYAGSSVYALWAEKCKGISPQFTEETLKLFEIGKINEPYLSQRCRLEFGWDVQHDPPASFRRSRHRHYLTASLDGWFWEDGEYVAIEMKGINAFSIRSEWDVKEGKAPLKYTIQLQHQLAVTGWNRGYLVALSGLDVYKIPVHRNQTLIDAMLLEYDDFWNLVKNEKEPEVDDSDATYEAINRVYTRQPMQALHLEGWAIDLVEEILKLERSLKSDESRLARMKNDLAKVAKGNDYLIVGGEMYSYMAPKGGGKRQLKLFKGKV